MPVPHVHLGALTYKTLIPDSEPYSIPSSANITSPTNLNTMKLTIILPLLAFSFQVVAAPAPHDTITPTPSSTHTLEADESTLITKRGSPRFSCGQYKFADNTVQEFYSQVWANIPADQMLCRHFKYEFHSKKGQEGTMVAAKVDKGCTCFFYE